MVEFEIAIRAGEGVRADIEVRDAAGAAASRVNGKAAGETERIENVAPMREGFDVLAIFALIEKKSGLLAANHIGFEAQTILEKLNGAVGHGAGEDFSIEA